jgi:hypothetical protein
MTHFFRRDGEKENVDVLVVPRSSVVRFWVGFLAARPLPLRSVSFSLGLWVFA